MKRIKTLIKSLVPNRLLRALLPTYHLLEAVWWSTLAGFPARKLKVIGVTGTNGKTTTTSFIHRMLHEAGYNVGFMTTVEYGVGLAITQQPGHVTNVPIREFLRRLKAMKRQGMEWLVLETTSHALAQYRVWGVPFSIAVITNITRDHLDYHGSFEAYKAAKRRLFQLTNRNRHGRRIGVVNRDDESWQFFADAVVHPMTYGTQPQADVVATNIKTNSNGVAYDVILPGEKIHITTSLPGSFNVSNSLAAVVVGQTLGLTPKQIQQGISALEGVEGRMTRINEGQQFSVIVDFAHTPDSFEKVFRDLRPVIAGKLIVVFGSAGHRDKDNRALQGALAGRYADIVVATEEDDHQADGLQILEEIAAGAASAGKKQGKDLFLVHDRTEAINRAVRLAKAPEDTVLILGKGHEKNIFRNDGEHPWDEIQTAKDAIANM